MLRAFVTDPAMLISAASEFGTPVFVYDAELAIGRLNNLRALFGGRFGISYAIKANPNPVLCRALSPHLSTFDASSIAEVELALTCGMPAARITFSGPAKRQGEIARAVELGIGELVIENLDEAEFASNLAVAAGTRQSCLVRINPVKVPRKFGASMAGAASQFGIDEEEMEEVLPIIAALPGLHLKGFHAYSGTNCLDSGAIGENFAIFADIFRRSQAISGIAVESLVFGSGFGVPYLPSEAELDVGALPALINPVIDELCASPGFADTQCQLELGRWLLAPAGWLLTKVIVAKHSRGSEIRACDAGFNNHLAACGMMGSVLRRNWVYQNLTNPNGAPANYTLVGPLCTSIDRLAFDIELPEVRVGDILSIPNSGAYGFTASPSRFISHPDPREVVLYGDEAIDASVAVNPANVYREYYA